MICSQITPDHGCRVGLALDYLLTDLLPDSIFRTAIAAAVWASGERFGTATRLSAVHGGGSAGARDRRYRSSSSESTRNAYAQTGSPRHHVPRRSRARRPFYGTYWKRAFQSSPEPLTSTHTAHYGVREFAPLDVRIDTDDTMGRYDFGEGGVRWSDTRYSFSPPVRSADPGSKLYALERAKIKDFHLPFFRLTPPHSGHSGCSGASRSVEFEIEAYFTYLRQFCEEEGANLEKGVQANGYDNRPWLEDYDVNVHEKKKLDSEFQRTCDTLREALREIEHLASPTRLRWRRTPRKDQDQQSIPDETVVVDSMSSMTRSYSLPNGVGVSQPLKPGDRHSTVSQTPSSYAIVKRRRQVPEKYSWVQNGDDTADHVAAAEQLLASRARGSSDTGIKRVSSLPQISEHTETTASRARPSKSIEGLSRRDGQDEKTQAADVSHSQDTTDVSQSMDSMEMEETATATATNTVTERPGHARIGKEENRMLKSALKPGPSTSAGNEFGSGQSHLERPASDFLVTAPRDARRPIYVDHNLMQYEYTPKFRKPLAIFQPFPPPRRRWGEREHRILIMVVSYPYFS